MRLIDADELTKDRVENDPVRIAAECAPTAFDKEKVLEELKEVGRECNECNDTCGEEAIEYAIDIVEKGGVE